VTREQLAMTAVLMSRQAVRHPKALTKKALSLEEVLNSPLVAPVTNRLECARRADGGAAVIVASSRFMQRHGLSDHKAPVIIGGGEASGPLYPPKIIDENMFSCEEATNAA
jgi:acetyl-CoA acetyltransferase